MTRAVGKRPECGAVVHPGSLVAEDMSRLGISAEQLSVMSGVSAERITRICSLLSYPSERDSKALGPPLGRGAHNLYRHAQAHRKAGD